MKQPEMDNTQYLKTVLKHKKLLIEKLNIDEKVHIATFKIKREMLQADIDSIEKQLEYDK